MYIGPAKSAVDIEQARLLAARVFSEISHKSLSEVTDTKLRLWDDPVGMRLEYILVVKDAERVIGTLRLLPRKLYRYDEFFECAGISSVCIDSEYRGKGLSSKLMHVALEQARSLGFEIVMLFARRAVDFYYTKFGIYGLSSYTNINISCANFSDGRCDDVSVVDYNPAHLEHIKKMHATNYRNSYGYIERNVAYWEFIVSKAVMQNLKIKVVLHGEKIIGYVVLDGDKIVEISAKNSNFITVLKQFSKNKNELVIEIHSGHPGIKELLTIDFRKSSRQCVFGGHMVGIVKPGAVISKFKKRMKKKLSEVCCKDFKDVIGCLDVEWRDHEFFVKNRMCDGNYFDLESTALLLGIQLLTAENKIEKINDAEFNILTLDHI